MTETTPRLAGGRLARVLRLDADGRHGHIGSPWGARADSRRRVVALNDTVAVTVRPGYSENPGSRYSGLKSYYPGDDDRLSGRRPVGVWAGSLSRRPND